MERIINMEKLEAFKMNMYLNEKSQNTINKYMHDIKLFCSYVENKVICKDLMIKFKEHLLTQYTVASANSMIAAINSFLRYLGWLDCCIKQFKVQRKVYCSDEKELTKEEYVKLVTTAKKKGNERLNLLLQTVCGTGIRVSELKYITVESVKKGEAEVSCKGKVRVIFIVKELKKKLLSYAAKQGIKSGEIFITKNGKSINRSNIWREMKNLCLEANVNPDKVFPHNLRHLFARTFYGIEKDIAKLADILGHSSIETTRIYIITTRTEHKKKMENMRLIL